MNGVFPAAPNDAARCRIQACRVEQVSRRLNDADCPAIVLFDPVNIRYATGKRNMQVGAMHNICRYAVLFASGEAEAFCHSLQTCEQSVAAMRERLQPRHG